MKSDLYCNAKVIQALAPEDWATTKEGLLIDTRGYTGVANIQIYGIEDASLAATNKLDVTVHNVLDNDEAPVSGNQVAEFDQIVAQNDATPDAIDQQIRVDLDALDPTKPYLQLLLTETNTWEGLISAVAVLGGAKAGPVNS